MSNFNERTTLYACFIYNMLSINFTLIEKIKEFIRYTHAIPIRWNCIFPYVLFSKVGLANVASDLSLVDFT